MKKRFRKLFSRLEAGTFRIPHSAFRNSEKGFTLIELAIVMVIIGIILGAVLKGQDLIDSARSKKFVNDTKKWEVAIWSYMDRKGRMPGDGGTSATLGKNGIIGDDTTATTGEQIATTNGAYEVINANFTNPPANPITVGSLSFYVYLGYDTVGVKKNVMVICKDAPCTGVFTTDELKFIESFDSSGKGVADAGSGNIRAATAVTLAPTGPTVANAAAVTDVTEVTTANASWATTHKAAVYYFDRQY